MSDLYYAPKYEAVNRITEPVYVRLTELAADTYWADLPKAVIEEFILIPRADLPEVVDHQDGDLFVGQRWYDARSSALDRRDMALANLAVAEHLEARDSEQAAVDAKRVVRRDELAREFSPMDAPYEEVSVTAQKAVDRIIELEATK